MTRYARAQGSKADNKRVEEEATPWSLMVRGIRPPENRRREQPEKNPEDFDETDDIAFCDDDEDDNEDGKKEESEGEDSDEAASESLEIVYAIIYKTQAILGLFSLGLLWNYEN